MEERLPEIKHAVIGVNREKIKNVEKRKLAAETILIFYSDKTSDIVDLSSFSDEEKEEIISEYNAVILNSIKNPKYYETLFDDSKDFEKLYNKAEKMLEKDEDKRANKLGLLTVAAGIGAGMIGNAIAGIGYEAYNALANKDTTIEQDSEQLAADMTGKDFAYYSENALSTNQKTNMLTLNNFASKNGAESWQKVTLTEEQMKQYGYENKEAIFGFTAEEAFALSLRFGHHTNDEYVTLMGGSNIDVVSVIDSTNSLSNNALNNIISYYICSDDCKLNIGDVINFNEKEQAKVNEFEGMLAEWKTLAKDEDKEKEAFVKMQEIKSWFNEFAYTVDPELDNAKSYLLRTALPACSIISQTYQYKDKVSIEVYDTTKDVYTTKEVKTALFDELMLRNLVTGFKDFEEEKFLKENDISSTRYTLNLSDEPRSIADKYCDGETERLYQANDYIDKLRTENTIAEAAYQGSITINPNSDVRIGDQVASQMDRVNTKYDELTEGTYPVEELLEMINDNLKEKGIYPENINYFRTTKLSEIQMEYNSKHGVTQGKKGDKVTVKEETAKPVTPSDLTASNAVVLDQQGNVTTPEQAMEEARQEDVKETGIKDASTPEASEKADQEAQQNAAERAAMLQGVYDASYNYFYSGNANGYNAGWATSSDSEVVNRHNTAKADAENRKKIEAEVNSFNQQQTTQLPTIDKEFDGTEMSQTPKQPVVNNKTDVKEETKVEVKEEVNKTPSQENNTETKEETITDGFSTSAPSGFAPIVDSNATIDTSQGTVILDPEFIGAEMYSLDELGLTEEEWDMLILPPEEITENTNELTGPRK